ncbi:hypothetical protein [Endozoicomonas sp. 8E]|uniref:hypothetical protein n=1 Tax=Endozoicomonas sp. 8E TaxID=3035692 RepID=UPI0029392AFC|nr:hypothetical protein [Endozoicomonas sp. 8E]WOG27770.1 hypothetical protein P6910_25020 [Endozoicomonas sp. 8E]
MLSSQTQESEDVCSADSDAAVWPHYELTANPGRAHEFFWLAVQNFSLCSYSFFLLRTNWDMHHSFIHQSRWLSLFVLLLSAQVLAAPFTCKRCGKELFCRTCDSGNSTSSPSGPSSCADEDIKSSAAKSTTDATISEIPEPEAFHPIPYRFSSVERGENGDSLMVEVKVRGRVIDAVQRAEEDGDASTIGLAELIASNLVDMGNLRGIDHVNFKLDEGDQERLPKLFEMVEQKQKQIEFLKKMYLAACGSEVERTIMLRRTIHERVEALTRERAANIDLSKWPDLSYMGMTHLLTAEFQNASLMFDLTAVFQAIQEGNMIQLIITQTLAADEGNHAAAGTVTPVMLAALIPEALFRRSDQTESPNIHLVWGTPPMIYNDQNLPPPLRFNQHDLMNALTAIMNVVSENEQNADLSLHFFTTPQTYIQDNEDLLLLIPDIEHSINRNLPDSAFSSKM